MRLLIVHNEYAAQSGEEHALGAIADLLEENGHEVKWFLRSSADIKGVTGQVSAFFSGVHNPSAVKDLRRFLHQHVFDVALVQNLYPLLSPSIIPVLKEFSIPVVMRCPNYRLFCPTGLHLYQGNVCEQCLGGREYRCVLKNCENNLFKSAGYALRNAAARMSRRIADHVDLFIVLSEFQKRRFADGGIPEDRLEVLPNIAPEVHNSQPEDVGEGVTFVGRVSPEKGIDDFLSAARRLPDIPFFVAGDSHGRSELVRSSPKNVRWLGFLGKDALADLYRRSRVLVFPSKWFEGFPNVITQAMMCRKPVIASRIGAIPEILDGGLCGDLFEPGNVFELTAQIKRLHADTDRCRRLGGAGQRKAETVYHRTAVYRRLGEILDRARSGAGFVE